MTCYYFGMACLPECTPSNVSFPPSFMVSTLGGSQWAKGAVERLKTFICGVLGPTVGSYIPLTLNGSMGHHFHHRHTIWGFGETYMCKWYRTPPTPPHTHSTQKCATLDILMGCRVSRIFLIVHTFMRTGWSAGTHHGEKP